MPTQIPFSKIFYRFWRHIIGSFSHWYGLNYLLAAAATYVIVRSGLDWAWYRFCVTHPFIFYSGFVSVLAGMFVPIMVPLWLLVFGRVKKNLRLQVIALALGQAAIMGWLVSTFIKIFTGRIPPSLFGNTINNSSGFRFGLYRGGWFDGWPSSHTTVAFALAAALIALYPDSKTIKICAMVFALTIGLGVSTNIHWFSDFAAGALIGLAIGKTIGADYKGSLFVELRAEELIKN
jgi:membrane-associated phospholipid phosphatase